MANQNAQLLIIGATAVGGFVLGKAILDHVAVSRTTAPVWDVGENDFEEQHYRAAGFTKKRGAKVKLDNIVSVLAGAAGIAYTIYQVPDLVTQLKALAK